ncbi:hypothetical protein ACHWQZ_G011466 [Mnemiopsis leidyi]
MCLVCLMSSGLYGVAVFSVNLREHHHDSVFTMYVNYFAPFLMYTGMVTIPLIHYWRNAKLKAYIDQTVASISLELSSSNRESGIADPLKRSSRISRLSFTATFWAPIKQSSSD